MSGAFARPKPGTVHRNGSYQTAAYPSMVSLQTDHSSPSPLGGYPSHHHPSTPNFGNYASPDTPLGHNHPSMGMLQINRHHELPFTTQLSRAKRFVVIAYKKKPCPRGHTNVPIFYNSIPDKTIKSPCYLQRHFSLVRNVTSTPDFAGTPLPELDLHEAELTTAHVTWRPTAEISSRLKGINGHGQEFTPFDFALMLQEVNIAFKQKQSEIRLAGGEPWEGYIVQTCHVENGHERFRQLAFSNTSIRYQNEELNDGSVECRGAVIAQSCQGEQGWVEWPTFTKYQLSRFAQFCTGDLHWLCGLPQLLGGFVAVGAAFKAYIGVSLLAGALNPIFGFVAGIVCSIPPVAFYYASNRKIIEKLARMALENREVARLLIRFATKHPQLFPKTSAGLVQLLCDIFLGLGYAAGNIGMVIASGFFNDGGFWLELLKWYAISSIALTNFCVGTDKARKFTNDAIGVSKIVFGQRNLALAFEHKQLSNALEHFEAIREDFYRTARQLDRDSQHRCITINDYNRRALTMMFEADKDCSVTGALARMGKINKLLDREINFMKVLIARRRLGHIHTSSTPSQPILNGHIHLSDARERGFKFKGRFHHDDAKWSGLFELLTWKSSLFLAIAAVASNIFGIYDLLSTQFGVVHFWAMTLAVVGTISAIGLNKGATDQWRDWFLMNICGAKSIEISHGTLSKTNRVSGIIGRILSAGGATTGIFYTIHKTIPGIPRPLIDVCAAAVFLLMYDTKLIPTVNLVTAAGRFISSKMCCGKRERSERVVLFENYARFQNDQIKLYMQAILEIIPNINSQLRSRAVVENRESDPWACAHWLASLLRIKTVISKSLQRELGVYPYPISNTHDATGYADSISGDLEKIRDYVASLRNGNQLVRPMIIKHLSQLFRSLSLCSQMLEKADAFLAEGDGQRIPYTEAGEPTATLSCINEDERRQIIQAHENFASCFAHLATQTGATAPQVPETKRDAEQIGLDITKQGDDGDDGFTP